MSERRDGPTSHDPPREGAPLGPYRVRTCNLSTNSANRIHDDEVAARYGFRGGLVAGSLVYAHMTTPLVARLGERWLDAGVSDLRLVAPAYDGEEVCVSGESDPCAPGGAGFAVHATRPSGEEIARLQTHVPDRAPAPGPVASAVDPRASGLGPWRARSPAEIAPGRPLRALEWSPAAQDNRRWCEAAGDDLDPYRDGPAPRVHPGRVLQAANDVFSRNFDLPPWMHVGSRIVHRAPVRVGDRLEVRAVPTDKWERKGHRFVSLYVVVVNAHTPVVEIEHTAIYEVRPREERA